MAGLGKYKKGVAFTLKSGNKPTFVQMGSSPAKHGSSGHGKGRWGDLHAGKPGHTHPHKGTHGGGSSGTWTSETEWTEDKKEKREDKKEDSPNNLNNFGIGPGGSPYKQNNDETDDPGTNDGTGNKEEKNTVRRTGSGVEPGENTKAGDPKEPAWKKALKVGTTLLSGGIQGVYGGEREAPKVNWGKWTQEELDESSSSKIARDILSQDEKDAGLSLYEGKKQSKAVEFDDEGNIINGE